MRPSTFLATWFGVGLIPSAPGTWGSLAALPFAWAIHHFGGLTALGVCAVVLFGIGCWASAAHAKISGNDDPSEVVIDEVAGQWIALLATPMTPAAMLGAFLLFRFFDILKPWPVSLADRKIKGGFGIMFDDALAGILAGGAFYVLSFLIEA